MKKYIRPKYYKIATFQSGIKDGPGIEAYFSTKSLSTLN